MDKSWLRQHWPKLVLILLMGLAGIEMIWLTIARYQGFNAGFDLAAMSQAIWSVTQGKLLLFSQNGIVFSRLARHVELIYFPIAFFYALWPSPPTLLIIQAMLYALGGLPVYWLAKRHLHNPRPALISVVIYLMYPVAQTSVLWDFHGDTLAMPLLLFMLESADRKAWRSYVIWMVLALSCKMYVSIAIALMGGVLWLKGERKAGLWTFGAAAVWGFITFFVLRALFAPPEASAVSATAASYLNQYFGQLDLAHTGMARLFNSLVVLVPVLPLAFYAPLWFLPGLALAGAVLVSSSVGPSYAYQYHHYALAVPFFIMAVIVGAGERRRQQENQPVSTGRRPLAWRLQLFMVLLLTVLFNSAFVNTPLNGRFYTTEQFRGRAPARYGITPRDQFLHTWLNTEIPPTAPLIVDGYMVAHVTNRPILYHSDFVTSVRPFDQLLAEVDYVVIDVFSDPVLPEHLTRWQNHLAIMAGDEGIRLTVAEDGLLLFARQGEGLPFALNPAPFDTTAPLTASFYDQIGLVAVEVTPLGENRFQVAYTWVALSTPVDAPPLLAMTMVEGWDRGRVPHPASLINPPTAWPLGVPMRETLTIELPADLPPGSYPLSVNWYNYNDLLDLAEDDPNPDHRPITTLTLEIP
jgi:uncharacterized membrane protein